MARFHDGLEPCRYRATSVERTGLKQKLKEMEREIGRNSKYFTRSVCVTRVEHRIDTELEEIVAVHVEPKTPPRKGRISSAKRASSQQDSLLHSRKTDERYIATKQRQKELSSALIKERKEGYELAKKLASCLKKSKRNPSEELERLAEEYAGLTKSFQKSEKIRLQQKAEIERLQTALDKEKMGFRRK